MLPNRIRVRNPHIEEFLPIVHVACLLPQWATCLRDVLRLSILGQVTRSEDSVGVVSFRGTPPKKKSYTSSPLCIVSPGLLCTGREGPYASYIME